MATVSLSAAAAAPTRDFPYDIPLRWGDMDALGHVNNVVYFRLMEEARVQLFSGSNAGLPEGKMIVLAHASCDFAKPIVYPGSVRVIQKLVRIGRSSLELDVVLERADQPGTVYASGRNVLVFADVASGKSAPWPDTILSSFAAVFGL
jgi:acyl-CoA thioester hydrolase